MSEDQAPAAGPGPALGSADKPADRPSWHHRVLDWGGRTWTRIRIFLGLWFMPTMLTLVALLVILWTWWRVGSRPVLFGLVATAIASIAVWIAIKVYYVHIIEVELDGSGQLQLGFVDVPVDIAHLIKIDGATGYVKDRWGRELRIVRDFNPETLTGTGTWEGNLTPLHFAARWETAEDVVEAWKILIKRYGSASVKANLDALGSWTAVAEFASNSWQIPDFDFDAELKAALEHGRNDDRSGRTK